MSKTNISYELNLNVDMFKFTICWSKYISTIYNTEFIFIKKSNHTSWSRTIHLSSKRGIHKLKQVKYRLTKTPHHNTGPQESLGRPNSLTVPASLLLSYLPSLSSQAYASSGLFGCHATVKVGDSHWISHSFSPTERTSTYQFITHALHKL